MFVRYAICEHHRTHTLECSKALRIYDTIRCDVNFLRLLLLVVRVAPKLSVQLNESVCVWQTGCMLFVRHYSRPRQPDANLLVHAYIIQYVLYNMYVQFSWAHICGLTRMTMTTSEKRNALDVRPFACMAIFCLCPYCDLYYIVFSVCLAAIVGIPPVVTSENADRPTYMFVLFVCLAVEVLCRASHWRRTRTPLIN